MVHIRTTKTGSNSTAVQVVRIEYGDTIIIKHIGSAKNEQELILLKKQAEKYISDYTGQFNLFNSSFENRESNYVIQSKHSRCIGIKYRLLYAVFQQLFGLLEFDQLKNQLLLDLVMMRLIEPSSKIQTIRLLEEIFEITYSKSNVFREINSYSDLKEEVEEKVINFAKNNFNFDFTVVFYDVTTLYFESFKDDDFKKCGFSKDNKFNQPQIVIGLIVNANGFPISYDVYQGNIFEGHTLIPTLKKFKEKYKVDSLTVVADAAMISKENIQSLKDNNLNYIVGARISNLPFKLMKTISHEVYGIEGAICKEETKYGHLICDFSQKRYLKNKYEMDSQITKAEKYLDTPEKATKRIKFLKNSDKMKVEINKGLIEKNTILLGIKGYYTNLDDIDNKTVIKLYHNLWNVEKAFRMAKSDLKTRPIYHRKEKTIKAHILICFMALAVGEYIEIKSKLSLQRVLKIMKTAVDVKIKDEVTGQIINIPAYLSTQLKTLLQKLNVTY